MSFVLPYPSRPELPHPQQLTVPLSSSAHVDTSVPLTATAVRPAGSGTTPPFTGFCAGVSSSPMSFVLP